jgi:protocatechuate 3,4-dioxygenase, beta subunit
VSLRAVALFALLTSCNYAAGETAADRPATESRAARANLYQCEGCEGALERNAANLRWHANIGPGTDRGEALRIDGRVLSADNSQPVPDVVIYAYQTNAEGLYANGTGETIAARRHGRLRGWVVTGQDGRYRFDTIKPAPYPNDTIPAHIHFTVLEPGRRPYWIDDIVFAGEFGVTDAYRQSMVNQGGNGIVTLQRGADGRWLAHRDIILERHPETAQ